MHKKAKSLLTDRIFGYLLLISAAMVPSTNLWAANVTDLYESQVLVIGQGDKERAAAIRKAMEKVLIKVSGKRDVVSTPEVEDIVSNAMQYVQQFRYIPLEELEEPSEQELTGDEVAAQADAPGGKDGFTQQLRISFDDKAVNQAMLEAGLPLWGHARPTTLLWVAVEAQGKRYILGSDVNDELKNELMQKADDRGLPLLVPLLDLEDQAAVRFTDIWGNFKEVINNASLRYQPEASLVGRVYQQPNGLWGGRWSLYYGDNADHWLVSDGEMNTILAAGVDGAADKLAGRYAQAFDETEQDVVIVAIHGIETVQDYARTLDYLKSLDAVTKLAVKELVNSSLVFELSVRGGSDRLKQNIAFGKTLLPDEQEPEAQEEGMDTFRISYRLLP